MKRKADQVQLEDRQAGKIAKGQNRLKPEDKERIGNAFVECLYHYFTENEMKIAMKSKLNLDEKVTELIWKKMNEKNPQFFEAYALRIRLRSQIYLFNELVKMQRTRLAEQRRTGHIRETIKSEENSTPLEGNPHVVENIDQFLNFDEAGKEETTHEPLSQYPSPSLYSSPQYPFDSSGNSEFMEPIGDPSFLFHSMDFDDPEIWNSLDL